MALRLNPLSSKGQKYTCELCGSAATLCCQHCRSTYYCCAEHQSIDWYGIHEKTCQLIGALRTLNAAFSAEDERQRRQLTVRMSQHALIELCKNEAQKLLVQGQYELAIPGALQALRFSIEVYGSGTIELVSSYLLLAESNLGLRRLAVAEEFLLYANWAVLKNPGCSNELKSQLCRNFGKLYACQRRFPEALLQLAQDVYYCSLEAGPEHITAAAGYFYMGDVCLLQGQPERALTFFDKVVDAWYRFLAALMETAGTVADYVSEAHLAEAVEMLKSVLAARATHLGARHLGSTEAAYALAMLLHATGRTSEALLYYLRAQAGYEHLMGSNDPAVEAIKAAVEGLRAAGVEPSEEVVPGLDDHQGSEDPTVGPGTGLMASKIGYEEDDLGESQDSVLWAEGDAQVDDSLASPADMI